MIASAHTYGTLALYVGGVSGVLIAAGTVVLREEWGGRLPQRRGVTAVAVSLMGFGLLLALRVWLNKPSVGFPLAGILLLTIGAAGLSLAAWELRRTPKPPAPPGPGEGGYGGAGGRGGTSGEPGQPGQPGTEGGEGGGVGGAGGGGGAGAAKRKPPAKRKTSRGGA